MSTLTISASPHIRDRATTRRIMLDVIIALMPALVASVWIFGARAALIVAVCAATCVISEWLYEKLMKKPSTIGDLSAVVTGILLAYNLPATIPVWQAVFGSAVAIILVKQLFGGLGKNFANPAITARIVMFLAFSVTMTTWVIPPDMVSGATPLALLKKGETAALPQLLDMFLASAAAVWVRRASGAPHRRLLPDRPPRYLLHIPVTFIVTVFVLSALLGREPVYQVMSGGLVLGVLYGTPITSPLRRRTGDGYLRIRREAA